MPSSAHPQAPIARRATNPFSSSRVRPGALDFVFPPGPKLSQLLDRLHDTGGWGQIVGAHGSGKTTLLATLDRHLARHGFLPARFTLHNGQRRMPRRWLQAVACGHAPLPPPCAKPVVIVDGFEQLSWLASWKLRRICLTRQWGLLVTTHAAVGLPILYRTSTTVDLAETLVGRLQDGWPHPLDRGVIQKTFANHHGDLRGMFFELFDHFEQHRQ